MLCLTIKDGLEVTIGHNVRLVFYSQNGHRKIGIEAPKEDQILRSDAITKHAVPDTGEDLPSLPTPGDL